MSYFPKYSLKNYTFISFSKMLQLVQILKRTRYFRIFLCICQCIWLGSEFILFYNLYFSTYVPDYLAPYFCFSPKYLFFGPVHFSIELLNFLLLNRLIFLEDPENTYLLLYAYLFQFWCYYNSNLNVVQIIILAQGVVA